MNKLGRPPASWLSDLKDGEYSVTELMQITNKPATTIRWIMNKYAKSVRYAANPNSKGIIVFYLWDCRYYLQKLN